MKAPTTHYVTTSEGQIAYQTLGEGSIDLVFIGGQVTQIDLIWDLPETERFLRRLGRFCRVILFDRLGAGISDPLPPHEKPSETRWARDLLSVLDDLGIDRAVLTAERDGCAVAMHLAAFHPGRVSSLVLGNPSARFVLDEDYPEGETAESIEALCELISQHWGSELIVGKTIPGRADDAGFCRLAARFQRASATPRMAAEHYRAFLNIDSRPILSRVRCPTLLLHRERVTFFDSGRHARYLESRLVSCDRREIEGSSMFLVFEHADVSLGHIEEFLTGARAHAKAERRLMTVLFADVVGSTKLASEMGDAAWRDVVSRVLGIMRAQVERYQGRTVDTAGDGVFAVFDAPTSAIACGVGLKSATGDMKLGIRVGLHAGECEIVGNEVRGLVVHIGARVVSEAKPGEIWVTSTLRDLVVGGEHEFSKRGTFRLKGVDGARRLYALQMGETA